MESTGRNSFMPLSKVQLPLTTDIHETHTCSSFCTQLYQISKKSNKWFSCWY